PRRLVVGRTRKRVVPWLPFSAGATASRHGGAANHRLQPAVGDRCHLSTGRAERRGAGGARSDPANRQTAPPLKPRLTAFGGSRASAAASGLFQRCPRRRPLT